MFHFAREEATVWSVCLSVQYSESAHLVATWPALPSYNKLLVLILAFPSPRNHISETPADFA